MLKKRYYEEGYPEYYIEGEPLNIELCGNESIKELWKIILNNLEQVIENIKIFFNPPIDITQLDKKVTEIKSIAGVRYPDELRELYLSSNGHNRNFEGIFLGMNCFSLEEMLENWKHLIEISKKDNRIFDKECKSFPEGYIKTMHANPLWIPFATDICGNYIGIDLDPSINGTNGQVINFGRDEREKVVLADNLGNFLKLIIKELREGNFRFEGYDGQEKIYFKFKDDIHPIEAFKKIVKKQDKPT